MPPKSSTDKILDAAKQMEAGEKAMSKGLFKWKPDYEGGAMAFERAGVLYKNAGELKAASDAYMKAAHAHYKNEQAFPAGKDLELAANCIRDMVLEDAEEGTVADASKAAELYRKASGYYKENANYDKAVECLVRCAKFLEGIRELEEQAAEAYFEAMDTVKDHDREHWNADCFKSATGFFIKAQRWDKAAQTLDRQVEVYKVLDQKNNIYKAQLSKVVVQLHRGDVVAADKALEAALKDDAFASSQEGKAALTLMDAYDKRSDEDLERAVALQAFEFLDTPVARLAKGLQIGGPGTGKPRPKSAAKKPAPSPSPSKPSGPSSRQELEAPAPRGGSARKASPSPARRPETPTQEDIL